MNKDNSDIKVINSSKIYEMLELIRRRPELFLTSKSITSLQDFLTGYLCLPFRKDMYHKDEPNFDEFKYWVLDKDIRKSSLNSSYRKFLLYECNCNDEKAFDRFFEYLEEYKAEKTSK